MSDKQGRFILQSSPRKTVFTPDIYKNTEIILDPSRNSTIQSRQGTLLDQQTQSKPPLFKSRSSILSSHLQKEKKRSELVQVNKKKLDSFEFQQNLQLKQKIQHRRINSEALSSNFLQSRVSQVCKNLSKLKPNYEKALKCEIMQKKRILQNNSLKLQQKPQKLSDTLNKPGVTTWMNLASGGKLRSSSLDLPAPSTSRTLKTWDIFSGYVGSDFKKKPEIEVELHAKDDRGFCYKLDPIYHAYTLSQAVHYLQLRKQGIHKRVAARLSQRVYCNLHEKQVVFEKNYSEEDLEYQKLVERFERFRNQNFIKEGEIVKDDEIDPGLLKIPTNTKKVVEDQIDSLKKETAQTKEQEIREKPRVDPRLLEIKRMLRKSKVSKSLFPSEPHEKSLIQDELKGSDSKDEVSADESSKTLQEFSKDKVVRFMINAVLPKKEFKKVEESQEVVDEIQMNELKLLEPTQRLETIHERENDEMQVRVVEFNLPKTERKRKKTRKITENSSAGDEKPKKKIDVKQEILMKNNQLLQQNLAKKLEKLKNLAEEKKKAKEESLRESQKRKQEFMSKVQSMKERKELDSEAETQQVKKTLNEKFRIVEENKKKLEEEKEKKREEQRLVYESQRSFVEYLRSLSLTENEAC